MSFFENKTIYLRHLGRLMIIYKDRCVPFLNYIKIVGNLQYLNKRIINDIWELYSMRKLMITCMLVGR